MSNGYGSGQPEFAAPHTAEPSGYTTESYGNPSQGYGGNPYGAAPSQYGQAGYQPPPYGQVPAPYQNPYAVGMVGYAQPPTSGLAIASLIVALSGLAFGITAPIGLILGIVARNQIKKEPHLYSGEGLALGGIISGAIITGLGLAVVGIYAIAIFAMLGAGY